MWTRDGMTLRVESGSVREKISDVKHEPWVHHADLFLDVSMSGSTRHSSNWLSVHAPVR